jgi:hypothetical protein
MLKKSQQRIDGQRTSVQFLESKAICFGVDISRKKNCDSRSQKHKTLQYFHVADAQSLAAVVEHCIE